MRELVFFLEEPSARILLDVLLPRILPAGHPYRCIVFEGKQDLMRHLVRRMRGYRNPEARFIVLRDQDAGDCRAIKKAIADKCREAGRPTSLVRIACHELESWYLADLAAVEQGLRIPRLGKRQMERKYRDPDHLAGPKNEPIRLTGGRYQEIGGSRAIAPHLNIQNFRSRSFKVFLSGIGRMAQPR